MASTKGKINFPGAVVWVSYGKPTIRDKIGCQGVYIRRVLITNAPLFLVYNFLTKIGRMIR